MSDVDEIKQKIDIISLVGEYVQLTQAGSNWKARCPFHNEKTPSFLVSQEKQIFHCFGCGKGGDIFTFVQEMENLDFPETLRLLAKKAGVELRNTDPRVHSQKTRLLDIHRWATAYFMKSLEISKSAEPARKYLEKRGLSAETIMDFKIGFAPDSWDKLLNFLKSKNYTESEIGLAGLITRKNQGSGWYDRFRNRVIFPIADVHGAIIGLGGRIMEAEGGAKYLNSPQTPIYDKSSVVYGMDKAKQEIKQVDQAIFVEGYMDVISSHQAGVKNVVATSGTALTPGHLKMVKRYTNNVAFCFDQDEAGQRAAARSVDIALAEDMNIKIVRVLFGKDPDECIQKDLALWHQSIAEAKPYMEYFMEAIDGKYDLNDINQKKAAAKELLTQVAKMTSKLEQDFWLRKLSDLLGVDVALLWESMPGAKTLTRTEHAGFVAQKLRIDVYQTLFGLVVSNLDNIEYLAENLEAGMIFDEKWRRFYNNLILLYNKDKKTDRNNFDQWLKIQDNEIFNQGFFDSLFLLIKREFDGFSLEDIQTEVICLVKKIKKDFFQYRINEISSEIKKAESEKDDDGINQLFKQLQSFIRQRSQLD
ncbi:MAG TPA: DNA primase [Candidatus Bipolaricaulota bacterium]|nr:DNA primase [Candidatus Bipolaricaulota bacterium]